MWVLSVHLSDISHSLEKLSGLEQEKYLHTQVTGNVSEYVLA